MGNAERGTGSGERADRVADPGSFSLLASIADEQREAALLEQQRQEQAAQQGQGDPQSAAYMQVEQMKAQARMQSDAPKLQM
jgi:hypothetical protein